MSKKRRSLLPKVGIRYNEREQLRSKSKQLSLLEENYAKLEEAYRKTLENLRDTETGETIENILKNEAYAFIISEGLTEKFLDFRVLANRSRHQEAVYNAVTEAGLEGIWIDP